MDDPLFMDALLTPNRSMSSRGYIVLIGVMTAINVATAAVFLRMGAAPVPFFLGFDLLAVVVAFALSRRSGRRGERIQVSAAEVRVVREAPSGEDQMVWSSPTAFTIVDLNGEGESPGDLTLRLSNQRLPVATMLSRPERVQFASALHEAIARARAGSIWG